jgi:phage terminase large subunit
LRKAGDGKPRLFVFRGCTVYRDPRLIEAKKPASTVEEIPGYIWAPPLPNRAPKEEPRKMDDHGCDAMRYMVAQIDGLGTYSAA